MNNSVANTCINNSGMQVNERDWYERWSRGSAPFVHEGNIDDHDHHDAAALLLLNMFAVCGS